MAEAKNVTVKKELEELRGKGLAKNFAQKFETSEGAGLSTPEQEAIFLAAQRAAVVKKDKIAGSTAELGKWHAERSAHEANISRKNSETETLSRSSRGSSVGECRSCTISSHQSVADVEGNVDVIKVQEVELKSDVSAACPQDGDSSVDDSSHISPMSIAEFPTSTFDCSYVHANNKDANEETDVRKCGTEETYPDSSSSISSIEAAGTGDADAELQEIIADVVADIQKERNVEAENCANDTSFERSEKYLQIAFDVLPRNASYKGEYIEKEKEPVEVVPMSNNIERENDLATETKNCNKSDVSDAEIEHPSHGNCAEFHVPFQKSNLFFDPIDDGVKSRNEVCGTRGQDESHGIRSHNMCSMEDILLQEIMLENTDSREPTGSNGTEMTNIKTNTSAERGVERIQCHEALVARQANPGATTHIQPNTSIIDKNKDAQQNMPFVMSTIEMEDEPVKQNLVKRRNKVFSGCFGSIFSLAVSTKQTRRTTHDKVSLLESSAASPSPRSNGFSFLQDDQYSLSLTHLQHLSRKRLEGF